MPVQKPGAWLGEGDTPTFMNLLANGLNATDREFPGGWGGRPFFPDMKTFRDPFSNTDPAEPGLVISEATLKKRSDNEDQLAPFPDLFAAAEHDLAARMNWSVQSSYSAANHAPVIRVTGKKVIRSKPGATVTLKSTVSDPDGDTWTARWWQFRKTISETALHIQSTAPSAARVTIPMDAKPGEEFFVVMEVTDNRKLGLTRYAIYRIRL